MRANVERPPTESSVFSSRAGRRTLVYIPRLGKRHEKRVAPNPDPRAATVFEPVARLAVPSAITALDEIHRSAVAAGASDIHVEPMPAGGRVRQRVDGILSETMRLPAELLEPVVARIKILAGIDVAERRAPQDGRYSIQAAGRSIDARVSSVPTLNGERLVVRMLDARACAPSLEELDMPPDVYGKFVRAVEAPHGFVVVCGPTGSGKTTTLYASLQRRNADEQQLCSVEDPVEIRIAGVAQVQVNVKAGITFAGALRAFLRQDPDVVMVGEMRDRDTATVATGAALSGQLVLTTLHAPDAPRAVDRLAELGVARAALATALSGILSQRLVRKLCPSCRRPQPATSADARRFGIPPATQIFESSGCDACRGTGFSGRVAIFEYLSITPALRRSIFGQAPAALLSECAEAAGYRAMLAHGLHRALRGETSLRELRARAIAEPW